MVHLGPQYILPVIAYGKRREGGVPAIGCTFYMRVYFLLHEKLWPNQVSSPFCSIHFGDFRVPGFPL